LAKPSETVEEAEDEDGLTRSPTVTVADTEAGVILGTAAYMSPEQARGEEADRRADIWSFGVVLWEMLTGETLFRGRTVSDTLAGILRDEIDTGDLPPRCPPAARRLLRRCLERDPDRRLHDIADARIELEDLEGNTSWELDGAAADAESPLRAGARLAPVVLAAAVSLGLGILVGSWWSRPVETQVPEAISTLRAGLHPPLGVTVSLDPAGPAPMTLSPDGTEVVFGGADEKRVVRLYVQDLETGETRRLEGTEGAQYPFWSPDGEWIAFFTQVDETLKKIAAEGGPTITLTSTPDGKGGSWGADGTIVYAPIYSDRLYAVSADGGEPRPATTLDPERHNSHRHPRFLNDGRRFLYLARSASPDRPSDVMLGSLDGGDDRFVLTSTSQAETAGAHLFWVREGVLFGRPFDPAEAALEGSQVPLAGDVAVETAASFAAFSVSDRGLLTYHAGDLSSIDRQSVQRYDRTGSVLETIGEPASLWQLDVSPDGRRLAIATNTPGYGIALWLQDLVRGDRTRLTRAAGDQDYPVWAPDGDTLFFGSNQRLRIAVYQLDVGSLDPAELVYEEPDRDVWPTAITPDGATLVVTRFGGGEPSEIWTVAVESGEARPLLRDDSPYHGALSPDGRWIAYETRGKGGSQVFLTAFPEPARRFRVSIGAGLLPTWRADGGEIYFLDPVGTIRAVEVTFEDGSPRLGDPEVLFDVAMQGSRDLWPLAPLPNGEEFLVIPPGESSIGAVRANLIVDWRAVLAARE
ncbi:MAG: protein kinase, partial [Thermoanaerobaculia bacterium]|nr:protein kinase [Thermoanaerobaculia bacterium]